MMKKNFNWKICSIISFFCAAVSVFKGFHKMLVYANGEHSWDKHINAYVGGDAYNYIINGTYATAFFALATLFVVLGIGCMVLYYLSWQSIAVDSGARRLQRVENILADDEKRNRKFEQVADKMLQQEQQNTQKEEA